MRAFLAVILFSLFTFLSGCTDVITYANKSREEGLRLYNERAVADAAGAFRNAIRQDPRDYQSQYYLGVCYDDLNQHHQAFSQFRISLDVMSQLGRNFYDPAFRRQVVDTYGASIARHDENDSEINALEKRAAADTSGEDWLILAKAFRIRGDADRAIDSYNRAARTAGEDFFVRREFGLYLLDPLNQTKEAEYWLRQASRLNSHDEAVNAGLEKLGVNPQQAARGRQPGERLTPPPREAAAIPTPTAQPLVSPIKGTSQLPRD